MLVLFVTFFIITPLLTHSADNVLPSRSQSLKSSQLREPETPEEFMHQLRLAESALPQSSHEHDPFQLFGIKHSKSLSHYNENRKQESFQAIKKFMQDIGCEEFHDYFIALASSTLPNKTDDIFVKIPYFKKLAWKSQEEVNQVFDYYNRLNNEAASPYSRLENEATYPVNRLFLAAFIGTPININKRYIYGYPATHVLWNNDTELLKRLFHYGLNGNIGTKFLDCRSLQAALLLFMHGANFDEQHKKNDLINHQCSFMGSDNDSKLLALFLPYAPLNNDNQFGKKWFGSLIKEQHFFTMKAFIERIAILLQYGCHYDQEQVNRIITTRGTKSNSPNYTHYKTRVFQLFKQAETSRKNIVIGLHQRALTGKPFGFKRTPQI